MIRQNFDFGPLFGSTVGFDRVFDLLQSATRGEQQDDKYPPTTSSVQLRMPTASPSLSPGSGRTN